MSGFHLPAPTVLCAVSLRQCDTAGHVLICEGVLTPVEALNCSEQARKFQVLFAYWWRCVVVKAK